MCICYSVATYKDIIKEKKTERDPNTFVKYKVFHKIDNLNRERLEYVLTI